eukprot:EG_transcript_13677
MLPHWPPHRLQLRCRPGIYNPLKFSSYNWQAWSSGAGTVTALAAVALAVGWTLLGRRRAAIDAWPTLAAAGEAAEDSVQLEVEAMRAKAIRAELVAAGVDVADVFEKEELVRRLVAHRRNPQPRSPAGRPASTELPMELFSGTWHITAPVRGVDCLFLVDTGASQTLISAELAPAMGLAGSSGPLKVPLTLGAVTEVVTARLSTNLPPHCGGILGVNVLQRFAAVHFDFDRRVLRLDPVRQPLREGPPEWAGAITLQEVSLGLLPFIELGLSTADQAAACTCPALLDTGTPITIVTPATAAAARMRRGDPREDVTSVGVDGQPAPLQRVVCARVSLGDGDSASVRSNVRLSSGTPGMLRLVGMEGREVALLGMDLL